MKRVILLGLLSFAPLSMAEPCAFPTAPKVLLSQGAPDKQGSKLIQYWEVGTSDLLSTAQMPNRVSLSAFRRSLEQAVSDLSPLGLLKNSLPSSPLLSPERHNLEYAIQNAGSLIRPMGCLEALLLSQQTDRMDMVRSPTEFTAFVLRSRTGPQIKIYYYTVNQAGIGGLREILEYVEKDMAGNDWYLWMNLHNHNFFLNQSNISGVPAPSLPDVGAFRSMAKDLGLQQAWITNGFHTIHLDRTDFWKFSP